MGRGAPARPAGTSEEECARQFVSGGCSGIPGTGAPDGLHAQSQASGTRMCGRPRPCAVMVMEAIIRDAVVHVGMTDDRVGLEGQFRNPVGDDGRRVLEDMNEHHSPLHAWAASLLPRSVDGSVLDVGCGGGAFLGRLADRYPYAMLFGADISEESLAMTAEVNGDLHGSGGLELHLASVDDLPFDDGSMDVVTAVETYFFWPDLAAAARELHRVVSEGGLLMIVSEVRLCDGSREEAERVSSRYGARFVTDGEMVSILSDAGFEAEAVVGGDGRWVAFVARKP